MGRIAFLVPTFLAASGFLCDGVRAELLWLEFGGVITTVQGDLEFGIIPGTPFSGRYTYDTSVPDGVPGSAHWGRYSSPTFFVSFSVGTLSVTSQGTEATSTIDVHDDGIRDSMSLDSEAFSAAGLAFQSAYLYFHSNLERNVLNSDALPVRTSDLVGFPQADFGFRTLAPSTASARGPLTSVFVVPEPAGLSLAVFIAVLVSRLPRRDRMIARRPTFRLELRRPRRGASR